MASHSSHNSNRMEWRTFVRQPMLERIREIELPVERLKRGSSATLGIHSDVFDGTLLSPSGEKVKVSMKRLRLYEREDITLLLREIYVWSKLIHPNILPLLGFSFDGETGYPILVTRWMENGSAWKYIHDNKDCNILSLIVEIAHGLNYLHEMNVVHSDMRSDNVLVSDEGKALICDFGRARLISSSGNSGNAYTSSKSSDLRYTAYEVIDGHGSVSRFSKGTDVWAFGMTVYEIVTLKRPYYSHRFDIQVFLAIMRGDLPMFPQPSDLPVARHPHVTELLRTVCAMCWKLEPEERITMPEVVQKLDQAKAELSNPSHSGDTRLGNVSSNS